MANICISVHSLSAGGGVQELTGVLSLGLMHHGHKVTIVCPVKPTSPVPTLPKNVEIIYLGRWKNKLRYHLLFSNSRLKKHFKHNRYDVIVANTPQVIAYTAQALRSSKNSSKLYAVIHGSISFTGGIKQTLVAFMSRLFLVLYKKRVESFAAVSKGVALEVEKSVKLPVQVLYNPVINDLVSYDGNFQHSTRDDCAERRIIAVGRLHHQKGFDLLIKALSKIKRLKFILQIVGDGPDRNFLENLVRSAGLEGRVKFLGYRNDILKLMKDSDLFVLSSRWEGFGNVLVEALYCQLPIVSFNCPHGPSEVLEDGKWGTLVPASDIDGLANAIQKALMDKADNVNERWRDFCLSSVAKEYLSFMAID